ncbi:MAG: NAD-dependent epimerase/dehydratase family protein [Acidimicrobiales bacterium]
MLVADASIFVAGHTGLVGSALLCLLASRGFTNVLTADRADVDLRDQQSVYRLFEKIRPVRICCRRHRWRYRRQHRLGPPSFSTTT